MDSFVLFLILEHALNFSPQSMILDVGLSYIEVCFLYIYTLLRVSFFFLIINGCWIFASFSASTEMIICFGLQYVNMVYHTDLWILNHPCIPGMNPNWSWCQSVSSVAQSCPTLCDPMNCSTPGLPVHHQCPEFTQTHVHQVGDAIQPSLLLSSPSAPAPNPSQHQSLFQWVNSSHEVAKVLEFQL